MSTPFVGEITMFGGNFAPRGWAYCDGQLLAISQNDALFSLLGTTFGGDGRTTFGLPDLRGRIPLHQGTGPGLSSRPLGSRGGQERVTLTTNQMPSHSHVLNANNTPGNQADPSGNVLAQPSQANNRLFDNVDPINGILNAKAIANSGGSQPHNNLMPYQCVHYIIALVGNYPSRN